MSIEEMRSVIAGVYSSESWQKKVSRMASDQVTAIYLKFEKDGRFREWMYSVGRNDKPVEKDVEEGVRMEKELIQYYGDDCPFDDIAGKKEVK